MINGTFLVVDDLGFVLFKKYNVLLGSLIYDCHQIKDIPMLLLFTLVFSIAC